LAFAVASCPFSVRKEKFGWFGLFFICPLSVLRFPQGKNKKSPMRGHPAVSFLTLRAGGGADVLSCNLIVSYG